MRTNMRRIGLAVFVVLFALLFVMSCEEAGSGDGGNGDGGNGGNGGNGDGGDGDAGDVSTVGDNLIGAWSGTWEDTDFSVDGDLEMTISEGTDGLEGTGTINILSTGAVTTTSESATASGSVNDDDTISFTFDSPTIGSGSGTIDGTSITGSGTASEIGFGAFTFSGTIDEANDTITGTFDFTTGGQGTVSLTLGG